MKLTPSETMAMIVSLRLANRLDDAVSHYAPDAALVVQPGTTVYGREAVREGFEAIATVFPSFEITARRVVEAGALALHHSTWVAQGVDPSGASVSATGRTADVLAQQADGGWMVMIDNPWGLSILDYPLPTEE